MTALRMASGIVPAADPLSSAAKSAPKNGARSTAAEPAASPAMTAGVNSLDQPLEDQPVGDGGTVSAKRMICSSLGQEDSKLLPYTFDDVWLECGHGEAPSIWEASATPRVMPSICVRFTFGRTPYWRKLLTNLLWSSWKPSVQSLRHYRRKTRGS
jgi:hypothetical protein